MALELVSANVQPSDALGPAGVEAAKLLKAYRLDHASDNLNRFSLGSFWLSQISSTPTGLVAAAELVLDTMRFRRRLRIDPTLGHYAVGGM